MNRSARVGELVLVEWDDAYLPRATVAWSNVEDVEDIAADGGFECESVGWVVHVDPACSTLAAHRSPDEDQVGRLERIPRGCVRRVRVLTPRRVG